MTKMFVPIFILIVAIGEIGFLIMKSRFNIDMGMLENLNILCPMKVKNIKYICNSKKNK